MTNDLTQKAISAALNQNWDEAISLNREILRENSLDSEALNRLGRAYLEIGKTTLAKKTFGQVLKIDPYNQIALKNLKILSSKRTQPSNNKSSLNPNLFLEEPGKTKTASLVELANKEIILSLSVGDEVLLVPKKRTIVIHTMLGTYLGKLADDLSLRLISFIKGGNQYQAFIKSVGPLETKIFIKEISRAKRFANQPSFPPPEIDYQAFIPPDLVHESRPDIPDAEGEEKPEESEETQDVPPEES